MKLGDVMVGAVIGAGVTLALVGLWSATQPSPEVPEPEIVEVPTAPPPPTRRPLVVGSAEGEVVGDLESKLEELEAENAFLLEQLQQAGLSDVDFPEALPDFFREPMVRSLVERHSAQLQDVSIVDVDCSEYPCITVYEGKPGTRVSSEQIQPAMFGVLGDARRDQMRVATATSTAGHADGSYHIVFAYYHPDDEALVKERNDRRFQDILANHAPPP